MALPAKMEALMAFNSITLVIRFTGVSGFRNKKSVIAHTFN
jgi:hypothetical protein